MGLIIGDNFSYKARKPLDERLVVATLNDLVAISESTIYSGIIVYVTAEQNIILMMQQILLILRCLNGKN